MFKKVNNWHLSFMIITVSFLAVSVVQDYVLAAWQEPSSSPGSITSQNIVLNPMTSNLDLNNKTVSGANITIDPDSTQVIQLTSGSEICFDGTNDCASAWPVATSPIWNSNSNGIDYTDATNRNVGIGTNNPTELLHINSGNAMITGGNLVLGDSVSVKATKSDASQPSVFFLNSSNVLNIAGDDISLNDLSGNDLVYIDDVGTVANVGIGTNTPNASLHINTPSGTNAELDIQSGSANHWGIYQHEGTGDLRFWNGSDIVTIDDASGQVNATASGAGKYAFYGQNASQYGGGVYATGFYGALVSSNYAGGTGLIALANAGDYAAQFYGNILVPSGNLSVNSGNVSANTASVVGALTAGSATFNGTTQVASGYFQFPVVDTDPPSADCASTLDRGKAVFNRTTGELVICNFVKSLPPEDQWEFYYPQEATP